MSPTSVALLLVTACLHATWNALTKRATDAFLFLWSSMTLATLTLVPVAWWIGFGDVWSAGAIAPVLGSAGVHAVYFVVLARAYREGDLSLVYPIARGLGVALVPVLAVPFLGEIPTIQGALGIALVVLGIVVIGVLGRATSGDGPFARGLPRGAPWALATGPLIATYSLLDHEGVRVVHPLPFLVTTTSIALALTAPLALRRAQALRAEWRAHGRTIAIASTTNLSGYLLVLFAFRSEPAGYVVATRELSIVVAALVGARLLGEGRAAMRVLGASVVVAGVALVATSR